MAEFTWIGPVVIGVILGFLEVVFVHNDEPGMGWFTHSLHAIPAMFIFIFISMNLEWALGFLNVELSLPYTIGVRVIIAIVAAIIIKIKAAIVKGAGERTMHVLIIGALIAVAPFIWELAISPLIGDKIPFVQ